MIRSIALNRFIDQWMVIVFSGEGGFTANEQKDMRRWLRGNTKVDKLTLRERDHGHCSTLRIPFTDHSDALLFKLRFV